MVAIRAPLRRRGVRTEATRQLRIWSDRTARPKHPGPDDALCQRARSRRRFAPSIKVRPFAMPSSHVAQRTMRPCRSPAPVASLTAGTVLHNTKTLLAVWWRSATSPGSAGRNPACGGVLGLATGRAPTPHQRIRGARDRAAGWSQHVEGSCNNRSTGFMARYRPPAPVPPAAATGPPPSTALPVRGASRPRSAKRKRLVATKPTRA